MVFPRSSSGIPPVSELALREYKLSAPAKNLARHWIEDEVAHGEPRHASVDRAATKKGAHGRHQLVDIERFDEIVVRAGLETGNAIGNFSACRRHQRWRTDTFSAEFLDDLESVSTWNSHVRLVAVKCRANAVALLTQYALEQINNVRTMTVRLVLGACAQPISQGAVVGCVAAAATTGALIAMGHRLGGVGIPFAAVGAVLLSRNPSGAAVVTAGVVLHVAAMLVWSVVFVWLAERLMRRDALAAALVAAGHFVVAWIVAWTTARGLSTVLTLGDRIALALVLAGALVVGMRFAFYPRETADRARAVDRLTM